MHSVGYLHLNKQFDAWKNFGIIAGGWDICCFLKRWLVGIWPSKLETLTREFEQNFSKKSNAQGFAQGGRGHGRFWN